MNEDWEVLMAFLPSDWRTLADDTGALKGLRKDKSVEHLLRTLLLHLGCGHSLRETVVRARKARLGDLSDVALLKRLRKSRDWLHALCVELFRDYGVGVADSDDFEVKAFDATTVKEPGKTGGLWRIHYSVRLPSLACDFFKLTPTRGPGTGESFSHFPIAPGDFIVADRGYSTANGMNRPGFPGAVHLPKYDDESAKAWLYGKLLVALLVEKLIRHAITMSPWGYDLEAISPPQCVA